MSHDSVKLKKAIGKWLKKCCKVGYGEVYSGAALISFENYCQDTAALKASPGRIAFGREMNLLGFGRKRIKGLVYITGLTLKKPPENVVARRNRFPNEVGEKSTTEREDRAGKMKDKIEDEAGGVKNEDKVLARMKKETKARNITAGEQDT